MQETVKTKKVGEIFRDYQTKSRTKCGEKDKYFASYIVF